MSWKLIEATSPELLAVELNRVKAKPGEVFMVTSRVDPLKGVFHYYAIYYSVTKRDKKGADDE